MDSKRAMTYIVGIVKRVKDNEWVVKRPFFCVFTELYFVAVKIVKVRLKANSVEMEEAREVFAERLLLLLVEVFEVG